jgi:hypothetical protein
MVTIATTMAACCSDDTTTPAPTVQQQQTTTQAPPANTAAPSPSGPPTIASWVNKTCSPEGAEARTTSGGKLVCKKSGSDPAPEWHAAG